MNKEKPDLYEERMHGYGGAYNNTQNYLKGLDELCKFHKMDSDHTVLELGTNDGVSTSLFAYYAKEVTAIDLNKSDKLQKKLELNENIKFHQDDIQNIVNLLPDGYFDFIYIDANHDTESVLRDIKISLPKLKSSGIISGHDYINGVNLGDVKDAVDEFFKGYTVNIFEDTSWSVQFLKNK